MRLEQSTVKAQMLAHHDGSMEFKIHIKITQLSASHWTRLGSLVADCVSVKNQWALHLPSQVEVEGMAPYWEISPILNNTLMNWSWL